MCFPQMIFATTLKKITFTEQFGQIWQVFNNNHTPKKNRFKNLAYCGYARFAILGKFPVHVTCHSTGDVTCHITCHVTHQIKRHFTSQVIKLTLLS